MATRNEMSNGEFTIGESVVPIVGSSTVRFVDNLPSHVQLILTVNFNPEDLGAMNPIDYDCGIFDFRNSGNSFGSTDTKVFVRFDPGETFVYLGLEVKTPADKGDFGNLI